VPPSAIIKLFKNNAGKEEIPSNWELIIIIFACKHSYLAKRLQIYMDVRVLFFLFSVALNGGGLSWVDRSQVLNVPVSKLCLYTGFFKTSLFTQQHWMSTRLAWGLGKVRMRSGAPPQVTPLPVQAGSPAATYPQGRYGLWEQPLPFKRKCFALLLHHHGTN